MVHKDGTAVVPGGFVLLTICMWEATRCRGEILISRDTFTRLHIIPSDGHLGLGMGDNRLGTRSTAMLFGKDASRALGH